jgi:uncharacterized membrane protein YphA (DoxX/SURF4 family)
VDRRLPWLAIALIVLLRISIGWQFFYEGLWKYQSLSGPDPWTAEGYLKNAQGPFRNFFRSMLGDPDELGWLDYATVSARWNDWADRFAAHYQLTEQQVQSLNRLLDATPTRLADPAASPVAVPVSLSGVELPAEVPLNELKEVFTYDAAKQVLTAKVPVRPTEEAKLIAGLPADSPLVPKLRKLCDDSRKRIGYRHRLAGQLQGNPEFVGVTAVKNERGSFDIVMGTTTSAEETGARTNVLYGKIQEYKDLLADYEAALAKARISYQFDHADMLKKKLAGLRNEVVGPVRTLDSDFQKDAYKLLTIEQLARGAMPRENSPLNQASDKAMWGLLILGILLMLGLGTRLAALAGAFMLLNFYLVIPPWPGVPQPPSPEHSLIVNKNLIEVIALLAIAAVPSGSWFGLDAVLRKLCRTCCGKSCPPGTKK